MKNFLLGFCHFPRGARRFIVEPVQVQKPMDNVQAKLALERAAKFPGMPFCCLDADKNFAVLKGEHIGRPALTQELPV